MAVAISQQGGLHVLVVRVSYIRLRLTCWEEISNSNWWAFDMLLCVVGGPVFRQLKFCFIYVVVCRRFELVNIICGRICCRKVPLLGVRRCLLVCKMCMHVFMCRAVTCWRAVQQSISFAIIQDVATVMSAAGRALPCAKGKGKTSTYSVLVTGHTNFNATYHTLPTCKTT